MIIPDAIRISTAAHRGARYVGDMAASRFQRLAADGIAWSVPATVELQFTRAGRQPAAECCIAGVLRLACQRCDQPYDHAVQIKANWVLVQTEEAEQAALATAEPIRIEEDLLAVDEAVEQEVILDLPVLARCPACEQAAQGAAVEAAPASLTHRPFAGLRLK